MQLVSLLTALGGFVWFLGFAIRDGRLAQASIGREHKLAVTHHKSSVTYALGFFAAFLLLLFTGLNNGQLPRIESQLMPIHQVFAVSFATIAIAALYFNGVRFRRTHRYLIYPALACCGIALLTGLYFIGILMFS